jgi:hypothetical protein
MQHNFNFDKHQNLNFRCTFKFKLTYVREEAARVEKSMNSNWTVPVWEKLAEFKQDLGPRAVKLPAFLPAGLDQEN